MVKASREETGLEMGHPGPPQNSPGAAEQEVPTDLNPGDWQHRARAASESQSWDWMEQCPHPRGAFQQHQAVLGHPHPPQIPLLLTPKLWQSLPRCQQQEQQWAEARTTGSL